MLNDQLDQKKSGLLSKTSKYDDNASDDKGDEYDDDDGLEELKKRALDDSLEEDNYQEDGFEESHNKQNTIAALMKMANSGEDSPNKSAAMYGGIDESMVERCDEQEKTIKFQKAKIAALQSELEETLQQLAQKETTGASTTSATERSDAQSEKGTKGLSQVEKKQLEKIN